jgi:glucose/arabinose dehydrogenase
MNPNARPSYCALLAAFLSVSGALIPSSASAQIDSAITVETVAGGLEAPWAIDFAADGRAFITERPGRIRVMTNGQLQPEPWAILNVAATSESGLMGLALDPGFAANGYAYVAYTYRTADGTLLNKLVRMREDPATGSGYEESVLVDGVRANSVHDGGRVRFGPDGKLFWTMGDAGSDMLAQDPASPNGKIHRLETDGSAPADNPWPGSTVYSYGHRNPQGLAWQPETNLLFATEHGPSGRQACCLDEVNRVAPGQNYGWPVITGDETREGMISPVAQSGGSETWAPAGAAFVTSGNWAGSLLFTGLRGQALYRLTLASGDPWRATTVEPVIQGQFGRLRDIVAGPDGAYYVLTSNRDGRGSPRAEDDRVLRLTIR